MGERRPAGVDDSRPEVGDGGSVPAPSAAFLAVMNLFVLLAVCLWDVKSVVDLIFRVPLLVVLGAPFLVVFILVHLSIRKRRPGPWLRTVLYLAPSELLFALIVVSLILGPARFQRPNQRTPSVSPSGLYVLEVFTRRGYFSRWTVTIGDSKGNVELEDRTDFMGHFSVYWVWDSEDRVWLYNSDDGAVWLWERARGRWTRRRWGHGHTKHIEENLTPPEELYPEYARESEFPAPIGGPRPEADGAPAGRPDR